MTQVSLFSLLLKRIILFVSLLYLHQFSTNILWRITWHKFSHCKLTLTCSSIVKPAIGFSSFDAYLIMLQINYVNAYLQYCNQMLLSVKKHYNDKIISFDVFKMCGNWNISSWFGSSWCLWIDHWISRCIFCWI